MRHHELKIDPGLLDPIIRTFQVGDTLLLRETRQSGNYMREHGLEPEYTGKELLCRVTFVLRGPAYMVPAGYAVLSIQSIEPRPNDPQKSALAIVNDFVALASPSISPAKMEALDEILDMLRENNRELRGLEREAWGLPMFHSPGAAAIFRERRRQVQEKGYTAEHDARHSPEELAHLAAYYCLTDDCGDTGEMFAEGMNVDLTKFKAQREGFPFPTYEDLVRAGALAAAAVDLMRERWLAAIIEEARKDGMTMTKETAEAIWGDCRDMTPMTPREALNEEYSNA